LSKEAATGKKVGKFLTAWSVGLRLTVVQAFAELQVTYERELANGQEVREVGRFFLVNV
jgi:hypothetical protein